jgi:hypothetical protein
VVFISVIGNWMDFCVTFNLAVVFGSTGILLISNLFLRNFGENVQKFIKEANPRNKINRHFEKTSQKMCQQGGINTNFFQNTYKSIIDQIKRLFYPPLMLTYNLMFLKIILLSYHMVLNKWNIKCECGDIINGHLKY